MKTRSLFIMISETDSGVGRVIRNLTHYRYNHVSLTLDPTLRQWYAFARYAIDAPFYGGFLMEPVERFLANGFDTPVRIFRLEIPEEKARKLELLFLRARQRNTGLLYNYFDAAATLFGKKITIPGAYTCLGFACAVLEKDYINIEDLNNGLMPWLYYDGSLSALVPDSGCREDAYFRPIGHLRGTWESAKELANLTRLLLWNGCDDLITQKLHSTAL